MKIRVLAAALLIGAGPAAASDAESLGRLFHSAAERSALASMRKAKLQPKKPTAPRPSEPQTAQLHGYVLRSDGRSTLWMNGTAVSNAR